MLAGALLIAGMATAPTMVTGMTIVQQLTPEGRLNEGMTLAVTGLLGGIACGAAGGGWVVEHLSATTGYAVPVTAACCALLLSIARASATSTPESPLGSAARFARGLTDTALSSVDLASVTTIASSRAFTEEGR